METTYRAEEGDLGSESSTSKKCVKLVNVMDRSLHCSDLGASEEHHILY